MLPSPGPGRTLPAVVKLEKRLMWKGITAGAAAISAVVTQRLMSIAWRRVRGEPPPDSPADRRVTFAAALTWAVGTGVGLAVARVIAVRLSARAWEAATHEAPPET